MACWRVVAGAGVGGATPPLFALASELSNGPARGRGVAFVASHWMLGSLFAAILAKATLPADIEVDFSSYDGVAPTALVCLETPIPCRRRPPSRRRPSPATPSMRCLLDGVAMPVPHRSTEPARPRRRREMT